ncbi:hypothetical protein N9S70_02280 [Flavobacteriaceae bacterium]|nr:hypothetical protein [Flavobacteriaceae bacterium]
MFYSFIKTLKNLFNNPDYKNEIVKLYNALIEQKTYVRQLGFNSKH